MYISFYSCLFLKVLSGPLFSCLIYWMRIWTNISIFLSKFALYKSKQLWANKRFRGRPNNWWSLCLNLRSWDSFLWRIFDHIVLEILDGGRNIFWNGGGNWILSWYIISGGLWNFLRGGVYWWIVEVMLRVHFSFWCLILFLNIFLSI